MSLILIILAGQPAITTLSGKLLFTTLFAPIITLLPIIISPKITVPGPI